MSGLRCLMIRYVCETDLTAADVFHMPSTVAQTHTTEAATPVTLESVVVSPMLSTRNIRHKNAG